MLDVKDVAVVAGLPEDVEHHSGAMFRIAAKPRTTAMRMKGCIRIMWIVQVEGAEEKRVQVLHIGGFDGDVKCNPKLAVLMSRQIVVEGMQAHVPVQLPQVLKRHRKVVR